jgi:hypothetical protein
VACVDATFKNRYRITFADGSVGTRYYDKPLTLGQQILDRGSRHLITLIEREPDYGIGRAHAVQTLERIAA